jgi:hypothetical protein
LLKDFKTFEQNKEVDPFNEENWNEYDYVFEKPGLSAKHIKGGDDIDWDYYVDEEVVYRTMKEKNPDDEDVYDIRNKSYYIGYYVGVHLIREYFENIKPNI